MPAGIDQFISTVNKDFRSATALRCAFSIRFDFADVGSVYDDGGTVYLHLGFRELQSDQFPATVGKSFRSGEDRRLVRPIARTIVDGDRFVRNHSFQCGTIIGEIGLPNGLSRGKYLLANLWGYARRLRHLLQPPIWINHRVRRGLNPVPFPFGVDVHYAESPHRDCNVADVSFEVAEQGGHRQLGAIKMSVEVTDPIACPRREVRNRFRRVGGSRPLDAVGPHIFVNALDRNAGAFQKSPPIVRMRRMYLVNVTVDKRLEDALYVSADGRRVSHPVFLGFYSHSFCDGAGDMSGARE